MSPLMFRIFSLVAIALAAIAAQVKARADTPPAAGVQQLRAVQHHDAIPSVDHAASPSSRP